MAFLPQPPTTATPVMRHRRVSGTSGGGGLAYGNDLTEDFVPSTSLLELEQTVGGFQPLGGGGTSMSTVKRTPGFVMPPPQQQQPPQSTPATKTRLDLGTARGLVTPGSTSRVVGPRNQAIIPSNWVCVFGFPDTLSGVVLRHFENLGPIETHVVDGRNWFYIKFANLDTAMRAVQENGQEQQLAGIRLMLGVVSCNEPPKEGNSNPKAPVGMDGGGGGGGGGGGIIIDLPRRAKSICELLKVWILDW